MSHSPLKIIEKWDCHQCGTCCRGTTVALDEDDLKLLKSQDWAASEEFMGQTTIERSILLGGKMVLAKQRNGDCVFLAEDNTCRIHRKFGAAAKPGVCRMFPFHQVPQENGTTLTVRRSCPSAAAERGQSLEKHRGQLRSAGLLKRFAPSEIATPPAVVRGATPTWSRYQLVADTYRNLLCDDTYPMVVRLVHAVHFGELLSRCRPEQLDRDEFPELVAIISAGDREEISNLFRDRQRPSRTAYSLLRQAGLHFLRSHPAMQGRQSLAARASAMFQSLQFSFGFGQVPQMHAAIPQVRFDQLDYELGALSAEVYQPLNRFLETQVHSQQYGNENNQQPLVDSFRELAIVYPLTLWLLRILAYGRNPTADDAVAAIVSIERGRGMQGFHSIAKSLGESGQLERLIVWLAR